ncbi:MAG: hypothetical protein AAF191_15470, partial [Verrucomicrobiota bacterium]
SYPYAHFPLIPALAALLAQLSIPSDSGLLFLSALAAFAVLLLVDWILIERLSLSHQVAILAVTLLAAHPAMTRGFLTAPTLNAVSFLALAACLFVAMRRETTPTRGTEILFALTLLALSLSRAPGLFLVFFFVVLAVLADLVRLRKISLLRLGRSMEVYFLPVLVLVSLFHLGFGWAHQGEAFRQRALEQQHLSTFSHWYPPFLAVILPLLLLAPFFRPSLLRFALSFLPASWALYYGVFTSINLEPFELLTFLPILAPVFLLSALALSKPQARAPKLTLLLSLALAGGFLWVVYTDLLSPGPPPGFIGRCLR